jgi:blue copper oxidase
MILHPPTKLLFNTNVTMKKIIPITLLFLLSTILSAQNALFIPPALTGTQFNLNVQNGVTQFYPGINTPTYGVNGPLLAPTLIMNKWDWVTLNVTNNLTGNGNATTMHWHGLHVPPEDDGGPHQLIAQGNTWSPHFQVLNNAGTYWYHPHGAGKTDLHVSKGLAGMIIIKDSAEAGLNLPGTYGVDDFPLIIQTKAFDVLNQIAVSTGFDTVPMVNGTRNAYLNAPAQVVRLRLLNGSSGRSFMIGFSNNMNFYQVTTDGGLMDSAIATNRLLLSNGERAEILVDLSSFINDTILMKSYGSELAHGIMGADSVGDAMNEMHDYYMNPLNGSDFNLLELRVTAQTISPVTSVPTKLVDLKPWNIADATVHRTIEFDTLSSDFVIANPAEGPFGMNRKSFDMDVVNLTVHLNTTEIWTLVNKTMVAHPFHIHDIQFYLIDINGGPVPSQLKGAKDVVLVMPNDHVRFITKFEDFADNMVPYMYHCHLLHHEDEGMMGTFLVVDTTMTGIRDIIGKPGFTVFPNPTYDVVTFSAENPGPTVYALKNILGETILNGSALSGTAAVNLSSFPAGMYFLQLNAADRVYTQKVIKR